MDIKEQIQAAAFDMFSQYGIKRVSMDDIAGKAGISKRTLYGFFEDKEALLVEGIGHRHDLLKAFWDDLLKGSHTAVDIILMIYDEIMKNPRFYCQRFYEDLNKYPKAVRRKEHEKEAFIKRCTQLLNQGLKEGVFRKEVNFEIVALLAKEQINMIQPSKTFCKHSNTEVFDTVLVTFLRGVCTEKGCRILDKWINVKEIEK
ncbi:HTH-type transcriptional regulator RutR [Bacteroidales bacterium Barb6]|nr:HTH-type transcriptional regulator RutR [Bacteroidales bacterium Barb6XT]OAV71378.1 HTH-type transcriptional regulator RutR [Bacteroidales bacterium Barb4]OAV71948.1 HTH-type transcriptional regulator RutR [Bacteroidales bacterium Barb6]